MQLGEFINLGSRQALYKLLFFKLVSIENKTNYCYSRPFFKPCYIVYIFSHGLTQNTK